MSTPHPNPASAPIRKLNRDVPDFVPQAIFGKSPDEIERMTSLAFSEAVDDFDRYQGASFLITFGDEQVPISLRHYAGHPPGTTTMYVSSDFGDDVSQITKLVFAVVKALNFNRSIVEWQRRDGPAL